MDKDLNLYQRINKIMEEVKYLKKDKTVVTDKKTKRGYKAIQEEKVTSAVRKAMIKYGVAIIPIKQEHQRHDETVKDSYGNMKINHLTTVDVTYRIQNIDDKTDFIEAVSSGTGVDTQDKGVGKAMTYAYKYLLLRMFAIPTGNDPDEVSSESIDENLDGEMSEEQMKIISTLDPDKKERLREFYKKDPLKLTFLEAKIAINSLKEKGLLKDEKEIEIEKKEKEEVF